MPVVPSMPRDLRLMPFRGSAVVKAGVLSWTALRGAAWRRLLPDVYIAADVPLDHRSWCYAAAVLIGERGAISGLSAAFISGIDLLPRDREWGGPVEVTVTGRHRSIVDRLDVIRSPLDPLDVVLRPIRVTAPVKTAFDLARRLSVVEAVVAVDAMLGKRLFELATLKFYCDVHPRWPGGAALPMVIDLAEPLSESPMETRLRLVVASGGLPRPVAQHKVFDGTRFVGRLDLAYPDWKIGIEYDGDHHRASDVFRQDVRRLNALRVAGWTVLRFTAADVFRNPDKIVAQIRKVLPASAL